jgi:hypothetical protein
MLAIRLSLLLGPYCLYQRSALTVDTVFLSIVPLCHRRSSIRSRLPCPSAGIQYTLLRTTRVARCDRWPWKRIIFFFSQTPEQLIRAVTGLVVCIS